MSKEKPSYIVHLDMDAFFAAIEQRDEPAYRGKPVIVGADPKGGKGRGVVATCSYEARKYGIGSAMPISTAYQKCPHAVFLRGSMKKYREVSKEVFKILYEFTPQIQPISIDEAFLDITGSYHLFGSPKKTCLLMKKRIRESVGLTASAGLGPTKMAAKIASDLKKPNGFVEVKPEGLLSFLRPLPIEKIWGIGKKSTKTLKRLGIQKIGELAQYDVEELVSIFGKAGIHYWELANGIDPGQVETNSTVKSVSHERTFSKDEADQRKVESALMYLSEKISHRLRMKGLKGKTVTLKIRLEGFVTFNRSCTLSIPTNFVDVIFQEAKKLFQRFDKQGKKIRLVGIRLSNLTSNDFPEFLFDEAGNENLKEVHATTDKIHDRFGEGAIHRATDMFRG